MLPRAAHEMEWVRSTEPVDRIKFSYQFPSIPKDASNSAKPVMYAIQYVLYITLRKQMHDGRGEEILTFIVI